MKRMYLFLLILLPYLFVFISSLYLPRDPDLGWHLKYGEYFFKNGSILRENLFSSTMPDYQWANGSWGTDIITYALYSWGGFFALTIASAAIVTLTFFFFAKVAKLSLNEKLVFFPLLSFLLIGVNSNSFRGQQISLLFLGILIFLLQKYQPKQKRLWLIVPLFLVWINIHTESFLGLAILLLWIVFSILRDTILHNRKSKLQLFLYSTLFLITVSITFINPFGGHLHLTAISFIHNPLLLKVNEYLPFKLFSSEWWMQLITILVFLVISLLLFSKKRMKDYLPIWAITLLLLVLSFFVRRYIWLAFYLMFPFVHFLWLLFQNKKQHLYYAALCIQLITFMFVFKTKLPITQYLSMNWKTYCQLQPATCSARSATFLISNNLAHHIFTYYSWGGWLIWNYPQIQPSIDGRMHLWKNAG